MSVLSDDKEFIDRAQGELPEPKPIAQRKKFETEVQPVQQIPVVINVDPNSVDLEFISALLPEVSRMSLNQKRKFKIEIKLKTNDKPTQSLIILSEASFVFLEFLTEKESMDRFDIDLLFGSILYHYVGNFSFEHRNVFYVAKILDAKK